MKLIPMIVPVCAMLFASAAIAGPLAAAPGPVQSQPSYYPTLNLAPADGRVVGPLSYKARMIFELRREALRMQREDGGTLSPRHLEYLQGKLDRIEAHSS